MIDRLAGYEAIGFFVPGLAGPEFVKKKLSVARLGFSSRLAMKRVMGLGSQRE
jgi:hypothetical protein